MSTDNTIKKQRYFEHGGEVNAEISPDYDPYENFDEEDHYVTWFERQAAEFEEELEYKRADEEYKKSLSLGSEAAEFEAEQAEYANMYWEMRADVHPAEETYFEVPQEKREERELEQGVNESLIKDIKDSYNDHFQSRGDKLASISISAIDYDEFNEELVPSYLSAPKPSLSDELISDILNKKGVTGVTDYIKASLREIDYPGDSETWADIHYDILQNASGNFSDGAKIWDNKVDAIGKVRLTSEIPPQFDKIFNDVFKNDLQKWDSFCDKVKLFNLLMKERSWNTVSFEDILNKDKVLFLLPLDRSYFDELRKQNVILKDLEELVRQESQIAQEVQKSHSNSKALESSPPQASSSFKSSNSYRKWDKSEIDLLCEQVHRSLNVEAMAVKILGAFNKSRSNNRELRFGEEGELSVQLSTGLWQNFKTQEKGNMFTLAEEVTSNFKQKLAFMREFCDGAGQAKIDEYLSGKKISYAPQFEQRAEKLKSHQDELYRQEQAAKIKEVNALFNQKRDLKGSQAYAYLAETRKIGPALESNASDDLAFLPKGTSFTYGGKLKKLYHDSLASFARNAEGNVTAVSVTALENKQKADINLPKISYGAVTGSFVKIQEGKGDLFLAEGVETALSIKAMGVSGQIEASLGISNLKNRDVSGFNRVFICADNDTHQHQSLTSGAVRQAMEIYEKQGVSAVSVTPSIPGQDFNDVLTQKGVEGLRDYFKNLDIQITHQASEREEKNSLSSDINLNSPAKQVELNILKTLAPAEFSELSDKKFEDFTNELTQYQGAQAARDYFDHHNKLALNKLRDISSLKTMSPLDMDSNKFESFKKDVLKYENDESLKSYYEYHLSHAPNKEEELKILKTIAPSEFDQVSPMSFENFGEMARSRDCFALEDYFERHNKIEHDKIREIWECQKISPTEMNPQKLDSFKINVHRYAHAIGEGGAEMLKEYFDTHIEKAASQVKAVEIKESPAQNLNAQTYNEASNNNIASPSLSFKEQMRLAREERFGNTLNIGKDSGRDWN